MDYELLDRMKELADRPDAWESLDEETLKHLAFFTCVSYGATNDAAMIPNLMALYSVAVSRLSADERRNLAAAVAESVESETASANALLPFIMEDPAIGVVSTAALSTALLMPLAAGDPMTGPKYLLQLIRDGHVSDGAAPGVLSGLLLLGDRRVVSLLRGCWRGLGTEGKQQLAGAWSGFAYAPVIDFLVDWLEDADESTFGSIAGTLARIPSAALHPMVVDVERTFGTGVDDDDPRIKPLGEWTFEEYGRIIEPRLRDLERRESEPKVMPHVLSAWGL